ncbi:outer membrane lipid asymmetry maintenance protein MlaD [Pelagibaculum spongiae]|uniref:Outer membrane lipid asymmetry maintenance protein MlaD n=1 Tax=Pelagibaculum spongiae TaxID=2080658 RepID=A0A2V1H575_9GAMM|nr:outer membrane lipid asymmetry maintenance protein MlaD [Pelagibaculum spongiae]PVZ71915.1 outer membrane lipid asymmetry maintenance protein MlaD [Pelagibaculum spongiae]
MRSRGQEFTVGLFLIIGFAALVFIALKISGLAFGQDRLAYSVSARFENVGSLAIRAPVTIAGVKVGEITKIDFDSDTFEAVVTVGMYQGYNKIPADTSASIHTAGLLGSQYLALSPGGDDESLEQGSEIEITQSALVLEELVGQFLFNAGSNSSNEDEEF